MSQLTALTLSIAILAGIDTYLTATILPVPVFVTFIAWASFFACGGGTAGFIKSAMSNLAGLVIASLSLLAIAIAPSSPLLAAVSVGIGSGAMILAASHPALGYPPAIVFGFASTVATTVALQHPMTETSIHNPALIAAVAILVGAAFGYVSERFAALLATRTVTA